MVVVPGVTGDEVTSLLNQNSAYLLDILPSWVEQDYVLWTNSVLRFAVIMRAP